MKRITIPRILKKSFCTHLIILLIPLIVLTSFFYAYLLRQFQQTIYNAEQRSCENTVVRLDNSLKQLQHMAIQLGNDRDILFNNLGESVTSQIRAIDMMRYALSLNDMVEDIMLVGENDMIYSAAGSFHIQSYSATYDVPLQNIIQETKQQTVSGGFHLAYQDAQYLYFRCNYPFSSPYPAGVMLFKVSASRLIGKTSHFAYTICYNDVPMILFVPSAVSAAGRQLSASPRYKHFAAQAGAVSIAAYIDEDVMFRQFDATRTKMILLESFTVIISVLLISYFSYKNYQPFKQLHRTLVKIGLQDVKNKGDGEVPAFIQSMEMLFSQNQQLCRKVESEKLLTRELHLSKLLEDRYHDVNGIRRSLAEYGVSLSSEEYAVCIIKCNSEIDRQEYFIISETVRVQDIQIFFCYDINNRIAVIIGGKRLTRRVLEETSKHLVAHLNRYAIQAEAYISPAYNEISKINQAYTKAISMLDYKEVSNGTLHLYTEAPLEERKTYYPQVELNQLFTAVVNKEYKTIDILFQTIERQVSNEICDFSFAKTIAYALINTIIKSANPDDFDMVRQIRHYLWRLERINCKADTIALMGEMRADMTEGQVQAQGMEDAESRLGLILQHMNSKYDDPDFFIGAIAQKYGISANNLSQQFKRRFGITPAKYLNSMRVEKAKQLLRESALGVREVAQLSGFSDFSSFNRNFKAVVSISPSQYRSAVRNDRQA